MLKNFYKGSVVAFIILWVAFIFFDYWQKHPMYYFNIKYFQYTILFIVWGLIGGGLIWAIRRKRDQKKRFPIPINGLSVSFLGILLSFISIQFFLGEVNESLLSVPEIVSVTMKLLYAAFGTFFTILTAYVLGTFINKFFKLPLSSKEQLLINIAVGIMGIVGICFILGIFKILYWFTILPIFLIISGIGWRHSLFFVKSTLWDSILPKEKLNLIGYISFYIIVLFVSLNFFSIIIPFPRGWDALSLYVNLPSLINDYSGLVPGFQPYNWSLFMSIGFVLFQDIETTLGLSFIGGFLSIIAIYELGRRWLKIDVNHSLLGAAIFYAIPSIGFQSIMDQKVDLGLLFILLCVIILLNNWVTTHYDPDKIKPSKANKIEEDILLTTPASNNWIDSHMVLIGLLTGFGLGIKLTTLFTFFGVIACIWYVLKGRQGFFAIFALSFFGMLLVRMDEMSGLRVYHLSASVVMWSMLLVGIGLLVYIFLKDKYSFMKGIRLSVVYGLCLAMPFLPWLVKNVAESGGEISVGTLMNGKSDAPNATMSHFNKNWRKANKNK